MFQDKHNFSHLFPQVVFTVNLLMKVMPRLFKVLRNPNIACENLTKICLEQARK